MIQFDLEAETVPEVPKSEEIQTEHGGLGEDFGLPTMDNGRVERPSATSPALSPVFFPVLDIETAKQHFSKYLEKIDTMLKEGEAITVDSEATNEAATLLGTSAKQILKKIEEERQFYISEPNTYVKSVNTFVKIFADKLSQIEDTMKRKIASYRAIQEQKRREQELAAKKAAEELQQRLNLEAKEKGIEPAKVVAPAIPKEPPVTRTETGSAHGRKIWTFEVPEPRYVRQLAADIDSIWSKVVPEHPLAIQMGNLIHSLKDIAPYLVISEAEVRKAIKAGIREIPGIRIFQDDRTTFRT